MPAGLVLQIGAGPDKGRSLTAAMKPRTVFITGSVYP